MEPIDPGAPDSADITDATGNVYNVVFTRDYVWLSNEYRRLANEYRRLRDNLQTAIAERNSLQDQVRNCGSNTVKINGLELEIDRLKRNISQLETEKQMLNNKNSQLEDKFIKYKAEAQFMNNINNVDRMEVQNKIKDAIKNIESEKDKINALYIDCETKSKDMKNSIENMQKTIDDLKNQKDEMQRKLKDYETNSSESEIIKSLQNEIENLHNIIEKLKNKNKSKSSKSSKSKLKSNKRNKKKSRKRRSKK
jgi:predicted  nucleic acid-binding Zn-ribbon protein